MLTSVKVGSFMVAPKSAITPLGRIFVVAIMGTL